MAIHGCCAYGCERRISTNRLMCASHTERVPVRLRGELEKAERVARVARLKVAAAKGDDEEKAALLDYSKVKEELAAVRKKCVKAVGAVPQMVA